jgi:hypothetical protein
MLDTKRLKLGAAAALTACVSLALLSPRTVEASDRRGSVSVGIGVGIIGGLIAGSLLNEEAKSKKPEPSERSKAGSKPASKSTRTKQPRSPAPAAVPAAPQVPAAPIEASTPKAVTPAAAVPAPAAPVETGAIPAAAPAGPAVGMPISTPAEIVSAQEHLRYMGYDVPQASGVIDLKTKIAILQFQESIGQATTGVLTVEQLQALFMRAAERKTRGN